MVRLAHLNLIQLPERLPRRKKPGFGSTHPREYKAHSKFLELELKAAVNSQQQQDSSISKNPSVFLKVQMVGVPHEEDWETLGLTVLSQDEDVSLVLFSSPHEVEELNQRILAYGGEKPAKQKNQPYAGFVSAIESITNIQPSERLGERLKSEGITKIEDFVVDKKYYLDIEMWDLGNRHLREESIKSLNNLINENNGELLDSYVGSSLTIARVHISGELAKKLFHINDIALIDLPPSPDLEISNLLEIELANAPTVAEIDNDLPIIGIIDSGIISHPLLKDLVVGSIGVPESLGIADDFGHGTRVAGVSVYGDLRTQIATGTIIPNARICTSKVVNNLGAFDDKTLVSSQMRSSITKLNAEFNCRIFVISLGDISSPYKGGKIGTWACTLDELARELNVLIVVSAGNRSPRTTFETLEEAVTQYPNYLLEDNNGLLEPANALNVLTVGSISHGDGVDISGIHDMNIQPITKRKEPSPFTRKGPGVGSSIKPEVIDFGGTYVFDAVAGRLVSGKDMPSAGVLTLNHTFMDQLFTAGSGTSYSAPLVAYKASQLLKALPNASANLLRALLVNSTSMPFETMQCMAHLNEADARNVVGYGLIDGEKASYSDDARVTMFAEDELVLDHFAVYQIPIPLIFQETVGKKHISITLSFDPPVRHTRADYAGVSMNFRLIRGMDPATIFDFYRKREKKEGKQPEFPDRYVCKMQPSSTLREKGSVQKASITFSKDISDYGDNYFLVVRCESGWAKDIVSQKYAVVVEISHEVNIPLYARLTSRVRARV